MTQSDPPPTPENPAPQAPAPQAPAPQAPAPQTPDASPGGPRADAAPPATPATPGQAAVHPTMALAIVCVSVLPAILVQHHRLLTSYHNPGTFSLLTTVLAGMSVWSAVSARAKRSRAVVAMIAFMLGELLAVGSVPSRGGGSDFTGYLFFHSFSNLGIVAVAVVLMTFFPPRTSQVVSKPQKDIKKLQDLANDISARSQEAAANAEFLLATTVLVGIGGVATLALLWHERTVVAAIDNLEQAWASLSWARSIADGFLGTGAQGYGPAHGPPAARDCEIARVNLGMIVDSWARDGGEMQRHIRQLDRMTMNSWTIIAPRLLIGVIAVAQMRSLFSSYRSHRALAEKLSRQADFIRAAAITKQDAKAIDALVSVDDGNAPEHEIVSDVGKLVDSVKSVVKGDT